MANETITGKIFQLKDPSNSYNRFPRTVMEAVYGLNTYLQNQFSALADIYMPIEGITESKPLQEFVYRACPSSIKAKSVSLDRIYGKTLAWNQQLLSGNSTYDQFTALYGTKEVSNNIFIYTLTTQHPSARIECSWKSFVRGHKYYLSAFLNPSANTKGGFYITDFTEKTGCSANKWTRVSAITSVHMTTEIEYGVYCNLDNDLPIGATVQYKQIQVVDLTLMFGAGNEPSTVAEFESMFPGYHDYSAGKLISNDAESIETVGFNQWDEETLLGYYAANGNYDHTNDQLCSKNLTRVIPGGIYYIRMANPASAGYLEFDANGNFLRRLDCSQTITISSDAYFIKFNFGAGYGSTYNHDICINLSDPAKNGTYEPYRKSTMQLGLNNFKVKSHNIWDEEWELGLYDDNTGAKADGTTTIRNVNPIRVFGSTTYYFKNPAWADILFYTSDGQFISRTELSLDGEFITPANCGLMNFRMNNSYGTTYNNNICINISSSFNGQYEPHGDITITGGLKSAGTVYDEIVGNKYIKRVGKFTISSVAEIPYSYSNVTYATCSKPQNYKYYNTYDSLNTVNSKFGNIEPGRAGTWDSSVNIGIFTGGAENWQFWFGFAYGTTLEQMNSALAGTEIFYELATPIEYTLVSPLVPTVAAGTTEERISPNADGLSAPMVADMTYDANANNDSASAQYALTAGRLLNSHKLWGQDFDGTQDVTGALTGVTSITMNGALSGVTTLSASGAATLGSTLSVGGLATIAGGVKLTTTKKIWFDDTHYIELLNGYLHTNLPIVSDSYITAGAANTNA